MKISVLVVVLALSGCAPVGYIRPNTEPAQYNQDTAQCEFEIEMAQRGVPPVWYRNNNQQIAYYLGAAIGQSLRNQRLRSLCMQAKGYTPVVLDTGVPATAAAYVPPVYQINAAGQPGRGDMGGSPQPIGAAPSVAGLKGPSTYLLKVENMVKAGGCAPPAVAMTAKGAGTESFTVGCPNGVTMAVKCDIEACRVLQ